MTKKSMFITGMIVAVMLSLNGLTANAEVITIMAANTSSGNYQSYEGPGIRIFQGLEPDIVLIQEFKNNSGSLDDLVDEAFGSEYDYYVEGGGENIPNGIVSRFPIISSGEWNDSQVPDRDFAWAIIDIPGDKHLQCISVHLKASSGSSGTRQQQAQALVSLIAANFDQDDYIVLGGDLNTQNASESCLSTLNGPLAVTDHIPVDQNGNRNTSEPRSKPYDWCIPNDTLDDCHTTLVIGSSSYPNGLVFDSEVYSPLSEVSPVQYGDSHVFGMQHMAVMKAFDIPTSSNTPTPTRTPTPTSTRTPTRTPTTAPPTWTPTPPPPTATPTHTPTTGPGEPTNTPHPTNTPTATPTAGCSNWGCTVEMPSQDFGPGDVCSCTVTVCNSGFETYSDLPVFVVLDVYGSLFFAPGFSDFDYYKPTLVPGETVIEVLPDFAWPTGAGSAQGILWYAGITNETISSMIGDIGMFSFGWHE